MKNAPFKYVGKRLKKIYKWEQFQPTKEWVEQNVVLNSDTSPITGPMKLKYTPHLIEMFDDYDRHDVWMQVLMVSSQTSKTTYEFCCASKSLDKDVAPGQLMIPTASGIPKYLSKKLNPFMNGVKSVKAKMIDYTTTEKLRNRGAELRVAGGGLSVTGSSTGERKSLSVKNYFADEIGEFEEGAIDESIERTKAYELFFRKIILASTQVSPKDEINRKYKSCETKKEWELACPHCGEYAYYTHNELKWLEKHDYMKEHNIHDEQEIDYPAYKAIAILSASLECPHCKQRFGTEQRNTQLLTKKYRWNITEGSKGGKTIGYKANALSMYFTTLESIVKLIIEAKYEAETPSVILDKIYRGYLNDFYKQDTTNTNSNDILLLGNKLSERTIPKDVFRIYMGIDTQKDHFWYVIRAYCYGNVSHNVLHGRAETTGDLEILMGMKFEDAEGNKQGIDKVGIDRQGIKERTVEVDAWVASIVVNQGVEDFLFPTMGIQKDSSLRPVIVTTLEKDLTTGERRTTPLKALKLNNTILKNELQNTINRSIAKEKGVEEAQEFSTRLFYINQTTVDAANDREYSISTDYERQITSEEYIYKIDEKTGAVAKEKTWEKKKDGRNNHYWDCEVICTALSIMDQVNHAQKPDDSTVGLMLDKLLS